MRERAEVDHVTDVIRYIDVLPAMVDRHLSFGKVGVLCHPELSHLGNAHCGAGPCPGFADAAQWVLLPLVLSDGWGDGWFPPYDDGRSLRQSFERVTPQICPHNAHS